MLFHTETRGRGGDSLDVSRPAIQFYVIYVNPRDHTLKLSLIGFMFMGDLLCAMYNGFVNVDILSYICLLENSSDPFINRSSLKLLWAYLSPDKLVLSLK